MRQRTKTFQSNTLWPIAIAAPVRMLLKAKGSVRKRAAESQFFKLGTATVQKALLRPHQPYQNPGQGRVECD